ncbi:hypothetical protein [Streptomyces sp. NPDC050145]|uniref:hypothetical protein n=1 Tax=Streptomyces sp. NPDC050145 TaxID=3365602 RepID=UPI0037BDB36E
MKKHPKHDAVARLLREGLSNTEIGRRLHADKHVVGRIRSELGLPSIVQRVPSLEEKWAANTRVVDGGHVEWTGSRGTCSGTPVMKYRGKSCAPAGVAFRMRTGRDPQGYVTATCERKHCVAPDHVQDEVERAAARIALRPGPPPSGKCRWGHSWAQYVRYEPDGTAYCDRCKYLSKYPDQDDRADRLPTSGRMRSGATVGELLRRYAQPVDDGHVVWTGTLSNGTPTMWVQRSAVSVARAVFEEHNGRTPEGLVLRACDVLLCVAGPCMHDRPMRELARRTDALYAAIFGAAA